MDDLGMYKIIHIYIYTVYTHIILYKYNMYIYIIYIIILYIKIYTCMYFHVLYEFILFIRDRWVFRVTHHPGTIMHHPPRKTGTDSHLPFSARERMQAGRG